MPLSRDACNILVPSGDDRFIVNNKMYRLHLIDMKLHFFVTQITLNTFFFVNKSNSFVLPLIAITELTNPSLAFRTFFRNNFVPVKGGACGGSPGLSRICAIFVLEISECRFHRIRSRLSKSAQ